MPLKTRKPTGQPTWPLMLLAGMQKAGKTYAAAQVSASEVVGRTLWIPFGEDDPDEYGALPGVRFEIVEHDGTFLSFRRVVREAVAEPPEGGPTLIVVDSLGRVWDFLQAQAQLEANERARKKGRDTSGEEIDITSDLWNLAKSRWQTILGPLREHNGPVLATSRLEEVAVMKGGAPTGDRQWKVKAEKTLPGDVDVIVEMRSRSDVALTGLRSLKVDVAQGVDDRLPVKDFTVEKVWQMLGLLDGAEIGRRRFTALDAARSAADSERDAIQSSQRRQDERSSQDDLAGLRRAAWEETQRLGWDVEAGAQDFEVTYGKPVQEASPGELKTWISDLVKIRKGTGPREPQTASSGVSILDGLARRLAEIGIQADDRLPVLTGLLGRWVEKPADLSTDEIVQILAKLRGVTVESLDGDLEGFRDLQKLGAQMELDTHNGEGAGHDGNGEGPDAGGSEAVDAAGDPGGAADAGADQGSAVAVGADREGS